jgi:murein DD-endopeptidase MepM/ murein hydrolase activator NlpD
MQRTHRIAVVCGLVVIFAGCTTLNDQKWIQDTKEVSVKAADTVADTTTKTFKRMQHYLAEKDVLQTFHDAGEHSEAAVLDVLHKSKARVATGTSKSAPHATGAPGASVAALPAKGQHPAPAAAVPQKYAGNLRWPLDAGIVSSEFGERWGKKHKGIDIAADAGEPVYAIADADVIYAGDGLRGYGNVVILRHDAQMTSLYAHNSELKVHQGDHVTQGTLISLLGNTGHSTGPHVHFEIREGDTAVNPRTVLPQSKLAEVGGQRAAFTSARN